MSEHFLKVNRCVLAICRVIAVVTLSGSHLEIATILRIIHLWSTKTPVGKMASELSVSSQSIISVIQHLANDYLLHIIADIKQNFY